MNYDVEDIDTMSMSSMLDDFPKWCEEALRLAKDIEFDKEYAPENIVVLGMGGSGVSGDFLKAYIDELKKALPVYVIRNYRIPAYVTKNSLIFAVSYSGNTEETISAYREATKLKGNIIAITSGGKLLKLSKENKNHLVQIPRNIPPRLSTPYLFLPMLAVLQNLNIISKRPIESNEAIEALKKPLFSQFGKELAEKIGKNIPIVYASERFKVIAMKWKTDINENAKIPAFYNVYPEFNHNELNSYVNKVCDFHVIIIRDDEDLGRIRKRMKITKNLFKKHGHSVTEVLIRGDSFLSKLLSTTYIGLWLSYWLAIAHKTDPTPVEMIEDLKKELNK